MRETVYTASPELSRPREFLLRAFQDGRASPRIGWQLFRAGLRAGRRRLLLGHLWLVLPAITMASLCVYLQSRRVVAIGPTELAYGLHVLTGMVLWQTFTDALNAPLQELEGARHMISRSRLPHEAFLLAGLLGAGLNAVVRLALIVPAVLVLHGLPEPESLVLFPAGMLVLALLGSTLGLLLAPWGLLYADVRKGLPIVLGFGIFLTPVFYPAPESGLLRLNPLTPAIEAARGSILAPQATIAFVATAIAGIVGCILAWLIYRLARSHVIERLA